MSTSTRELLHSSQTKWSDHFAQYNDSIEGSSSIGFSHLISLAETFKPSLSVPDARAIDLGAGTGSLAFILTKKYPNLPILATDFSADMLEQIMSNPLRTTNITTQIADMRAPLGGAIEEGSFSHVFSTMTIPEIYDPVEKGVLAEWARLLKDDGILAVAIWDFDQPCGPHDLWAEAATAADPTYVNPPIFPEGHWLGTTQLENGLKTAGFRDVRADSYHVGFNVGKEGFMRFFWESRNLMPLERQSSFNGDFTKVKIEMERLLDEVYEEGNNIPLWVGVAVGRKPNVD